MRSLFHILECIYEILEKAGGNGERRKSQYRENNGMCLSSDIDANEMSGGNGYLNEIEEAKSDCSKNKKTSSIPR